MLLKRPETVKFDPSNKEHRAAVSAFLKRKAWADSTIRFDHDPKYGSVAAAVQYKLLAWYVLQEEEQEAKRAARPSTRNTKKIVRDLLDTSNAIK